MYYYIADYLEYLKNMKYYRLESRLEQIGEILDTNVRDNMARCSVLRNNHRFSILNQIVEHSIANDLPLSKSSAIYCTNNPEIFGYLQCIWEVLYERARPDTQNIHHYDCAFFFTDIRHAESYRSYPGMESSRLCEVEIIEQYDSFLADMQWLEQIDENQAKAGEIIDTFSRYWKGEFTDNPIPELLFEGKYILKSM